METKKLSFDIDVNQIDIKPLLKKEFLELKMKAISTANPNRNGSWFTEESLQKSINTFRNKPILGYFENGDFVSHNGEWATDAETGMEFWDTSSNKGEQILGFIRGDDELTIEQDGNGLSWICLSCALWVQYNFKQVKRLLKDAKKAQVKGGPAKNISVEVDILDYEILESGIMKINEFNLAGITILGSRNGMKVEPGIEDASVSVVDIMGKELFAKQEKALRLAYAKLDNKNKEENNKMDETVEKITESEVAEESTETFEGNEEACPDCGKNPCECAKQDEDAAQEEESCNQKCEEDGEEEPKEEDTDDDDKKDEDDDKEEEPEDKEQEACGDTEKEECGDCGEEKCEEESCGEDYKVKCEALEAELTTLKDEFAAVKAECEELKEKFAKASEVVAAYEKKEFLEKANALLNTDGLKISNEQKENFIKSCENDEITSFDALKSAVALAAIDSIVSNKKESYSAPIVNPDVKAAFVDKKATKKEPEDKWSTLHNYLGK